MFDALTRFTFWKFPESLRLFWLFCKMLMDEGALRPTGSLRSCGGGDILAPEQFETDRRFPKPVSCRILLYCDDDAFYVL